MSGQKELPIMTAAPAWLFLALAAAAATLPAALLSVGAVCGMLAVLCLLARLLRSAGRGWSLLVCLAAAGGFAWGLWMLFSLRESWQEWRGPQWLFAGELLLCAPAAVDLMAEREEHGNRPNLFRLIGVVLLIGVIRELLGAGTLFRIRLLPAVSDHFLYGAAGILIAGLCLPLAGWRERRLFRCPDREVLSAGLAGTVRVIVAGIPALLLVWLIPDAPPWAATWLTVASIGAAGVLLSRFCRQEGSRMVMADGVFAVAGTLALNAARKTDGLWWWLSPLWAGVLTGAALCLFIALYARIDNLHIPKPLKTAPATLIMAGAAMLALQALRFG